MRKAAFSDTATGSSPTERMSNWIGCDPVAATPGGTCTRITAERTSVGNTSTAVSEAISIPGKPFTVIS